MAYYIKSRSAFILHRYAIYSPTVERRLVIKLHRHRVMCSRVRRRKKGAFKLREKMPQHFIACGYFRNS